MKRILTGLMTLFLLVALGFGVNAAQASAAPAQVTQAAPSLVVPASSCCYRSTRYCYPTQTQFPGTWFRVSSWYDSSLRMRSYHVGLRSSWDGGTFSWSTRFANWKVGGVTYRSGQPNDPQYLDFYWAKRYTTSTTVAKIYTSWWVLLGGSQSHVISCTMTGA